ncbi:TetR/AcrR family transcriptional regulator [Agromyces laixinhei]|uniref:TetR/AcrR family transcriptional regulator n=1 Tax=Agromyces laixinhei TaxID=2585717 RepID=UPI00143D7305|nr:TetR/AcrR family transcriptional regulator [Agromyces laixinhei]
MLAEDGYVQASLSRIAKRAGVSRGVILYHFSGRDDLLDAVVSEVYRIATEELRPTIETQSTALRAVRTFIVGSAEFYRAYPAHMAALREIVAHSRSADGTIRHSEHSRANERELSALGVLFERGKEAGEFRAFSTPIMARTIRSTLDGLLGQMRVDPGYDPVPEAHEVADIFERAMMRQSE